MEKHTCKLCFKSFPNGRALGGHMRSHVMNLYSPSKSEIYQQQQQQQGNFDHEFGEETDSASSSSSPSSSEEENEDRELLSYGLRENPKKSIKLVNQEFSFAESVVLIQDRESESETESSKNPTRRRSKRIRKLGNSDQDHHQHNHQSQGGKEAKKPKLGKLGPWAAEPEPVSSISDTSPEEDVAYCLMMLSRDQWMREKVEVEEKEEEEEEEEEEEREVEQEDDESDTYEFFKSSSKTHQGKGKYKCETCCKVFKSYQALGGHRASHKKARVNNNCISSHEESKIEVRNAGNFEEKIHECPFCFRIFASGQALGGHKRSHVIRSSTTALAKPPLKFGESFIDLNLPAPIDDDGDGDEVSQIELSAVSDAEFVKLITK